MRNNMGRAIKFRQKLLRLLPSDELEALQSDGGTIDDIAHRWSPEIENVIRERVEAYITMARAEQAAESRTSRNKGLSAVKK
jgi:hypothetical protein